MKSSILLAITSYITVLALTFVSFGHTVQAAPNVLSLVPRPNKLTLGVGSFTLTRATVLVANEAAEKAQAQQLAMSLAPATGFAIRIEEKAAHPNTITFSLDQQSALGDEGYRLKITPQTVTIVAAKPVGLFYASQTLRQLLPTPIFASTKQNDVVWNMPVVSIEDAPRFKWRGLMLDCSRHFFSVEEVKKFLDSMAAHKLNTFHWHLTDDQGWRLEIKKYPKLTEIGSVRTESPKRGARNRGDSTPYGGFYTQAQAREIVAYAASRHIIVVPEIEMPGHASAAIAAYPQFGNSDISNYSPQVGTRWTVRSYSFAPKEETFAFLEDVLREVMDIFPSPYIHIGGDEVSATQWRASTSAREVMTNNNITSESKLQNYFVMRIAQFLHASGRRLIGWDEIVEGDLVSNAVVMNWHGSEGAVAAIKRGHSVVIASDHAYYFNYAQSSTPEEPESIGLGRISPLRRVYSFDPTSGLDPDKCSLLLGIQGQLWSEYLFDYTQVEYMTYPRAVALAETGWSFTENKDYADFYASLEVHLKRLKAMGVNFRPLDDQVVSDATWKTGQINTTWGTQEWGITPKVIKAGTLEVTFQLSSGVHPLNIAWCELLQDGHVVARDEHIGLAGITARNNIYHLDLHTYIQGAKYTLRAQVLADGGRDSNGDIFISIK